MTKINPENGLTVRNIRIGLGWTQQQLSKAMLVTVRTIERWESGQRACSNSALKMLMLIKDRESKKPVTVIQKLKGN